MASYPTETPGMEHFPSLIFRPQPPTPELPGEGNRSPKAVWGAIFKRQIRFSNPALFFLF